jgi:hypothetical protein
MPTPKRGKRPTASAARGARGRASESSQKNEGEGNKTAARRYDRAVEQTVRSGGVVQKAREAARALDGPEGGGLRRAEALAKQGKSAPER